MSHLLVKEGWFQVPNAFIDDGTMAMLSGEAVKVMMVIYRKTLGFHKINDRIPYSQIEKFTEIKHRKTIQRALEELLATGLISKKGDRYKGYAYSLLLDDEGMRCSIFEQQENRDVQTMNDLCSYNEQLDGDISSNFEPSKEILNKKRFKDSIALSDESAVIDRFKILHRWYYNEGPFAYESKSKDARLERIQSQRLLRNLFTHGEDLNSILVSLDAYADLPYPWAHLTIPHFCENYFSLIELQTARDNFRNKDRNRLDNDIPF